eukprot:6848900-Prymnesium_polylepis.1
MCEVLSHRFRISTIGWQSVTPDHAAMLFSVGLFQHLAHHGIECEGVATAFKYAELTLCSQVQGGREQYVLCDPLECTDDAGRITGKLPNERLAAGLPVLLIPLSSNQLHGVPLLPSNYVPRAEQEAVRQQLLHRHEVEDGVSLVGKTSTGTIAGTVGLGKTTTASWLAQDVHVQTRFRGGIFSLSCGKDRNVHAMLLELEDQLEQCGFTPPRDKRSETSWEEMLNKIQEGLRKQGLQTLLILDDVWVKEQCMPLKKLSSANVVVLLTTRMQQVANQFGGKRMSIDPLPDIAALTLLSSVSGKQEEQLRREGRLDSLLKTCSGLPVMLNSVGAMCRDESVSQVLTFFEAHKREHRMPENMAEAEGYNEYDNGFLALEVQLKLLWERNAKVHDCCIGLAVFPEDTVRQPRPVLYILLSGRCPC